jgi:outer membrane protein assembly factor BamE (lipoprotein component of BamABCDE complex)
VQKRDIPSITIKAMDYSFDQSVTIPAGYVNVSLVNNGLQPHQDNIVRLNDGISFDQLMANLKDPKTLGKALTMVTFYGGPNTIQPGKTQEVILNLIPGNYVSICFIAGQDNIPHFAKGMIKTFTVTQAPPNTTQVAPSANATILLSDFSFVLPATLPAGRSVVVQVTNQGSQPHEITLIKLHPGKTIQDAVNFLVHPVSAQPFDEAGGMGALQPNTSAEMELTLQPGAYGALCFVPDAKAGAPHFMLGMKGSFIVA